MGIGEEFKSRNFSIYGQWIGVICILICLAVGITNVLTSLTSANILGLVFSILCIVSGLVLIFVEVPLLMKVCPTSEKFDTFMKRFSTNYMRAAIYGAMSAVQFASLASGRSPLIAAAVFLMLAALCYLIAGVRHHDFAGSKMLSGRTMVNAVV